MPRAKKIETKTEWIDAHLYYDGTLAERFYVKEAETNNHIGQVWRITLGFCLAPMISQPENTRQQRAAIRPTIRVCDGAKDYRYCQFPYVRDHLTAGYLLINQAGLLRVIEDSKGIDITINQQIRNSSADGTFASLTIVTKEDDNFTIYGYMRGSQPSGTLSSPIRYSADPEDAFINSPALEADFYWDTREMRNSAPYRFGNTRDIIDHRPDFARYRWTDVAMGPEPAKQPEPQQPEEAAA